MDGAAAENLLEVAGFFTDRKVGFTDKSLWKKWQH
jgi:hypothetical protein